MQRSGARITIAPVGVTQLLTPSVSAPNSSIKLFDAVQSSKSPHSFRTPAPCGGPALKSMTNILYKVFIVCSSFTHSMTSLTWKRSMFDSVSIVQLLVAVTAASVGPPRLHPCVRWLCICSMQAGTRNEFAMVGLSVEVKRGISPIKADLVSATGAVDVGAALVKLVMTDNTADCVMWVVTNVILDALWFERKNEAK